MSAILVKSFVGHAEAYFQEELMNKRENSYFRKGANVGQWTGKGTEMLRLKGDIKKEDFSRMSRGVNPNTGKRFRRITLDRTRKVGGRLKQVKEIAGWDMVISAPKSVSIVGLIGKDERVIQAYDESVTVAMERAEQAAQANLGGGKKEQTDNLVIARFRHDSARPGKAGLVAPQLHDHLMLMNATFRADGTIKPLESSGLHKAQSYIRSVFYTELADRLQKLGYAVEIDQKTGAPEIEGISKEYRKACSPRRTEIIELAEKVGKNFRQLGLVNRREKVFDKNLIREQHEGIDGFFDYQAVRAVEAAKNAKPRTNEPETAKEAITYALTKLSKRESVLNPRVVLLEANKRGIGQTSVVEIEAELEALKRDGKVKTINLRGGREAMFLSSDAQTKTDLFSRINVLHPQLTLDREIQLRHVGILPSERKAFNNLSHEQQKAVKQILQAETGIVTLEGHSEVGKTTTLSYVGKMAKKAKYEVLGLTQSINATQELGKAQITSSTLQEFLANKENHREQSKQKRFYFVDETSFVSSRQMDKFFCEAVRTGDRVLLIGDTNQPEKIVEAGKSSARTEGNRLAADGAKIETSRRRTKKAEREIVKNFSEQQSVSAIAELRERGQIRGIKDISDRHMAIARVFIAAPQKSVVVAPQNQDRQEINSKIHKVLKNIGKVGKEEAEIKILRARDELTGVERELASSYRAGDIIIYTRGSAENKIAARTQAKVIKTDSRQNLLTVEIKDTADGKETRETTYNPKRLRGVSVWRENTIKVSKGDRLQFRAAFEEKKTKIADGSFCEVGKITPNAITLTTGKGKAVKLDRTKLHAIDYGYATASHSSQSKTIDRVLVCANASESKQILNEIIAPAMVSRARDKALIFTDNAEKLADKMTQQVVKLEITQAKTERIEHTSQVSEIKLPVIMPAVEKSPTPEIKIEPAQQKTIITADEPKVSQETLIKEVLQISRNSLAKQGIEPDLQAWKRFANVVINDLPNQKAQESQELTLEFLQKDAPQSERVSLAGKTSLEATHAILKLVPDNRRDEIVKDSLAKYEKQIAAECGDEIIKPEVKVTEPEIVETAKTTSFEKAARVEIKPTPQIRDFEAIGREELISELVAAARDEARAWKGEDLYYSLEKLLTKMYRQSADKKPSSSQMQGLNELQQRFSEPIPQPKNLIEATVLKLDNITDAEKSAALRGQITGLDDLIKREELQKTELEKVSGQTDKYNVYGRTDSNFTQELHRLEKQPERKSYYELTREAQQRGFLAPPQVFAAPEKIPGQKLQQALYQMEIANALQEQIKRSLDEQGIKLQPFAEKVINATVDNWANQQPTAGEYKNVQYIR